MYRVSSNLTLLLKVFFPTAWIVFFGVLTLAIFVSNPSDNPMLDNWIFRFTFLGFFILFFVFLYFTLMQLKRVEFGKEHIFISNYFKTYRYRFEDIHTIKEYNLLFKNLMVIHLKSKGKLGKKIPFLVNDLRFKEFLNTHPELLAHLVK